MSRWRSFVLDHRDLELTGQEQDRGHGQNRQRHPSAVAAGADAGQQLGDLGPFGGAREDVAEPVENAVRDGKPDRQERDQLDGRFESDRRDHALVLLGGVDVPRAVQDRERRHDQGDVKGGVLKDRGAAELRRHDDPGVLHQDVEAGRDALQLKGDIGRNHDHRDHRDEPPQELALAVAGGDEVGDRGDAVVLADAQNLAQQVPPQNRHQGRTEINGQEVDAARGGAADAAVERPGGAIDGDRKGVNIGTRDQAAPLKGALVPPVGDGEQKAQIPEPRRHDHPRLKHPRPLSFPAAARPAFPPERRRGAHPAAPPRRQTA